MYEMFKPTDYNLADADQNMLQYQIDTYGGNSGSPVFGQQPVSGKPETFDVVGVHVLGGYSYNSASVIDGNYGNRCHAYYNIASSLTNAVHKPDGSTQTDKDNRPWLWMCSTVTTEAFDDQVGAGLDDTIKQSQAVEADISSAIVDWDTPLTFGSKAGPQMAILASAAIAAAGRLAADSVNGSNVESLAQTRPYDGVLGRAILAESALQYFFSLTQNDQEAYRETMGPLVAALKPFVTKIAPRILKGTLEPSMRLLLSNLAGTIDSKAKRSTTRPTEAEKDTGFGRKLSNDEDKFLRGLMAEVDKKAIESFFTTLTTIGDVVGSAFRKAGPILKDVAKIGLPLLLGTESGGVEPTSLDPLAHRAILAEACLQTFVEIQDDATKKEIYPKMVENLKVLGPMLMRASPFVAKYIAPIVADILREVNPQNKTEFLDFTYGKA
ncbi:extracellular metalloprotease, partial [Metarhizium majus ARSEF 297]